MERVLLAIDGITPDIRVFRYAVELCRRIKAELNVLQIIRPRDYSKYLDKLRRGAKQARMYFEGSMVAASFAEAGDHETAKQVMSEALKNIEQLLQESEKAGILYHLTMKLGSPEKEIIDYVNEHRDVVLAIYDPPRPDAGVVKKKAVPAEIKENLPIPVVMVQDQK